MLDNIKSLIKVRKELHKYPELSGNEQQTNIRVKKFVSGFNPDEIIDGLGGEGVAFIFKSKEPGPKVLFRCELDALPIQEINQFSYRSINHQIGHKCGHDGHMSIIIGLAERLHVYPPQKGSVILLFQPSEENGQGALRVINDKKFQKILPDYVFALHNLPGYKTNNVILRKDVFSSASIGFIVRLSGKTSHAAEPEKGLNPAFVMASALNEFKKYSLPLDDKEGIKIITPIHVKLGERAFGTSPGYAELMFTIRATYKEDLGNLKKYVLGFFKDESERNGLKMEYEWVEEFPNTVNSDSCVDIVGEAALAAGLDIEFTEKTFRWSEDFGHFTSRFPGALFGLGAGLDHPALHNPDYDFPDDLIESGINIFHIISQKILK
jgi:amidohydrolase